MPDTIDRREPVPSTAYAWNDQEDESGGGSSSTSIIDPNRETEAAGFALDPHRDDLGHRNSPVDGDHAESPSDVFGDV